MLRPLKIILWAGCLIASLQSARAFSLAGPIGNGGDSWQTGEIGYGLAGDVSAPKNLGEEYRWNKPVVYYSFDQSFLEYFGSNGVSAVDEAFGILNHAFTNGILGGDLGVDGYSSDLSEFGLETRQENFSAEALQLLDVRSLTLGFLVEQLGLASPDRYVWTLHERNHIDPGPACPGNMEYFVVRRNFDPITFAPSSYVNDILYTYIITEACTGVNPLARAVPRRVDPVTPATPSAVANVDSFGVGRGRFFTDLTRDDAAGFKYLLRTNNINNESAGAATSVFTLTTNTLTTLTTSNLQTFLELLPVTDPATLLSIYPNLNITSVSSNYVTVNVTNFVGVFTNVTWAPVGFPPQLIVQQQVVQTLALRYTYTFNNVITNHFLTNWPTKIQTIEITPAPNAPAGSGLVTTSVKSTVPTQSIGGDFYILPPNVIGYVFGTNVIVIKGSVTNIDFNSVVLVTASKIRFQQRITYFTNYLYDVRAITLNPTTNGNAFFQGIQKMSFVRRDFDSLIGQNFEPLTNTYTMKAVVGGTISSRIVRRTVTQPDFLFSVRDIPSQVVGNRLTFFSIERTLDFNTANVLPNLAGPGTIEPQRTMTFNKLAPFTRNDPQSGFLELPVPTLTYGSFDASTNPPVVYPDGTSLANLQNQILMQVTSTSAPLGTNGVAYSFQLTGSGGSPPYTWSLGSNSPGLPPGLNLSSSGLISGTPTNANTFDFTVRMTDQGMRSVEQPLSITILP